MNRNATLGICLFQMITLMAACHKKGTTSTQSQTGTTLTYYGDIQPIVNQKCAVCHQPGGVNNLSLTTYDEVYNQRAMVNADVTSGAMPPGQANVSATPNMQMDGYLTAEESQEIQQWIAAGAPAGTPPATALALPPLPALPTVSASVKMVQAYTPQTGTDDFEYFAMPWTGSSSAFVTGIYIKPGTASEVHHILVFIDPNGSQYNMSGAPIPSSSISIAGLQFLGAFVPGQEPQIFPSGLGVPIAPGAAIVMQMHYNTKRVGSPSPDQTAVQLMTAPTVQQTLYEMLVANPGWVSTPSSMLIPAGQADVSHSATIDPFTFPLLPPPARGKTKFTVYSSIMHMHLFGFKGQFQIVRAGGGKEPLLNVPLYNFNYQITYRYESPIVLNKGDQIYMECHWNNSASNQPIYNGVQQAPRDVQWGETTEDEMCVGVLDFTAE